jgi:hypothetical protein
MIPIVELSPGEHNITVKKSNRVPLPASAPEMLTGKVNVEGSHRYRIRIGNGIVSLAEAK